MLPYYRILSAAIIITALSACGSADGNSSSIPRYSGAPAAERTSVSFEVLHDFQGGPEDGSLAQGISQDEHGALFGATIYGGHIHPRDCKLIGCGVVYEYDGSTERIIYYFQPGPDGQRPTGNVLVRDGILYGAAQGGAYNEGLIFSLRHNNRGKWIEMKLYDFKGAPDGGDPDGLLYIDTHGTLYGTTFMGGSGTACLFTTNGCGTVFALQPPATSSGSWRETIVHSFQGSPDGAAPSATLLNKNGALYGTTEYGGASTQCPYLDGCGTIYKITGSGSQASERVAYSFHVNKTLMDGQLPGALIDGHDGNLYGTTYYGGGSGGSTCDFENGIDGCGSFYSFDLKNQHVSTLYAFPGGQDGAQPDAIAGTATIGFYGVTVAGGSDACSSRGGCGTVFSIVRSGSSWNKTTLHEFSGNEGQNPGGSLVLKGSTLYGTASVGGTGTHCIAGCGTIYALSF